MQVFRWAADSCQLLVRMRCVASAASPEGCSRFTFLTALIKTAVQADYEMLSALDEGVRRRRPLSQAQLESLPTHVHSSRQEVTCCPYCLDRS